MSCRSSLSHWPGFPLYVLANARIFSRLMSRTMIRNMYET
jgi:hypothetical protein